jgi:hypothetical protein
MKKSLLLLTAILISFSSYSQDWFSDYNQGEKIPGYVLGMTGDTIEGFIKYDYPIIVQKRISFYSDRNDPDAIIYNPDNIWGFSMAGEKWIGTTVIMETYNGPYEFKRFGILESEEGPLLLLRIFNENDKLKKKVNSAEAEKEVKNITLNFPENSLDQLYIKKNEGEAESILSKEFKKYFRSKMKSYVGDNKDLIDKIDAKEYSIKEIYSIVNEYNEYLKAKLN